MAPSKQPGEGLLQWAAGTCWGQGGWGSSFAEDFFSSPLICFSALCSMMGPVLQGTEKIDLKDRPSSHQLSASPVEQPQLGSWG